MRESSRRAWTTWRFAAGLVVIAALAQACGGSSQSSGPGGSRLELRFSGVKGARLGLLPSGCQSVDITIQPEGTTVTITDTKASLLLSAGQHSVSGVLHCNNGQDFASNTPDPVFTVPPSLGSVEVALVFGGVNVDLNVQVSGGVQVTGPGINCPGDCSESYFAGTSVGLTANPSTAVFSGGCTGTGSCTALMNQDKTVFVGLGEGAIRVDNTGEEFSLRIAIDGSTVAAILDPNDSPVTKTVATGQHSVRAFCLGEGEFEHPDSPKSVNVVSDQTAQANFNGDDCFGQIQQRRRR